MRNINVLRAVPGKVNPADKNKSNQLKDILLYVGRLEEILLANYQLSLSLSAIIRKAGIIDRDRFAQEYYNINHESIDPELLKTIFEDTND